MNQTARAPAEARKRAARTVGAITLLVLCLIVWRAAEESWLARRALWAERGTGWLALTLLLASLSMIRLGQLAQRMTHRRLHEGRLRVLRRAIGMAAAWVALAHALVSVAGSQGRAWRAIATWPHLRAGAVALSILLALLVTSFDSILRRLRLRTWEELHRLAYVAALLSLQHLLLSPFASRTATLIVFGAAFITWLIPRRRPPLRAPPLADVEHSPRVRQEP